MNIKFGYATASIYQGDPLDKTGVRINVFPGDEGHSRHCEPKTRELLTKDQLLLSVYPHTEDKTTELVIQSDDIAAASREMEKDCSDIDTVRHLLSTVFQAQRDSINAFVSPKIKNEANRPDYASVLADAAQKNQKSPMSSNDQLQLEPQKGTRTLYP